MMRTHINEHNLYYWRDKSGREIDFVIKRSGKKIDIIECKANPDHFSPGNMKVFRESYPNGNNYCYSPYISDPYTIEKGGIKLLFIGSMIQYAVE